MIVRGLVLAAVALALATLWVLNCSGPSPVVADVQLLQPRGEGAPYRVEVTIRNQGVGHGEVAVTVRLRDRNGRMLREERKVVLEPRETTLVVVEIPAPRGEYTPEVEVEYPPR